MPTKRITKAEIEKAKIPERGSAYLWDANLKGFGVVLHAPSARHPKGSRVFVVRYRTHAGKDRRQVLGSFGELTQEQARAMAQDVLAGVRHGADPIAERRVLRAQRESVEAESVAAVYQRWYDSRVRLGKWKASTAADLHRMFKRDVIPMIGNVPIAQVSRRDVRRVLEAKADAPTPADLR